MVKKNGASSSRKRKNMKFIHIIGFSIIILISIQGCFDYKLNKEKDYDFIVGENNSESLFQLHINESFIISNDISNIIIKVIDGYGKNSNGYIDLKNKIIKIDNNYYETLLAPSSLNPYKNIENGDNFSFEIELSYWGGFGIDNTTLKSNKYLKYRYQKNLESINLGPDGIIELSHWDILNSPFPINKTQLIKYSSHVDDQQDDSLKILYWSPYYDQMVKLNNTEIRENGYFIIKDRGYHGTEFNYDSYLKFSYPYGNVTLTRSGEIVTRKIGNNDYYLVADNLYRETWFETYDVFDVPPARNPNSFYVIRK